jgi:hypothetical protein
MTRVQALLDTEAARFEHVLEPRAPRPGVAAELDAVLAALERAR